MSTLTNNGNDIVEELRTADPYGDSSDLLIKAADEIERLQKKCDDQAMILRRLNPENFPDTYFISCEYGPKDANGLPEKIGVVPAYGLDWHQIYVRTDKVNAPGW